MCVSIEKYNCHMYLLTGFKEVMCSLQCMMQVSMQFKREQLYSFYLRCLKL